MVLFRWRQWIKNLIFRVNSQALSNMIHAIEKFVDLIEPDPAKKLEVSEFKKYFQRGEFY